MPFTFEPTELPGVVMVRPRVFGDSRGHFFESFRQSHFLAGSIPGEFVQDNQSRSVRGTVRGLHFQRGEHAQGKLVRCLVGEICDVAVDIRPGSATFGQWVARALSGEDHAMLYVPPGFAHGFQVVTAEAEVLYKCTTEYAPDHEGGIMWNDPDLAIAWPVADALVSEKDARNPSWAQFCGLVRDDLRV
ncbi:MAG: dTDP-4-dehydrorhamnose 3,5-epimerase [Candidatus Sericytochromatia bacterium]|nr:dTDP-4-dehydrorhamnose 3,5-epimerase [Candidatus Tanganyikabacteria bacterium]